MERKYKITIPEPCHEDWNKMIPEETGKFCSVCTKVVVDFTKKSNSEIQDYFIKNQGQKVCGRFKNEQINKFAIQIPQSVLKQRMPYHKAFLLTLFIVMGATLFSCKNHNNDTLGDVVVVKDSIQPNRTTGIILPRKDSIPSKKNAGGDAKFNPNSIGAPPSPVPKCRKDKIVKNINNQEEIKTSNVVGIIAVEPIINAEDQFSLKIKDSAKTENK